MRKRDGLIAEFLAWNIVSALTCAGAASGEFGRSGVGLLADDTLVRLAALATHDLPHVELIQDTVESVLWDTGHRRTLRAYVVYREQHQTLRADRTSLVDAVSSINVIPRPSGLAR